MEKVEEAILISSTSSHRMEAKQGNVGCAVVATKAIIYSTQVCGNEDQGILHGEGSNRGSRDWPLTQRQNQEVEVNSSLGFWAEKLPFLSEEAKKCVSAAWRTGTKSRYEAAWTRYWDWVQSGGLYPDRDAVSSVENYLAHLFHEHKLAYRTINVHRSAISAKLSPYNGMPLGEQPVVCKVMKGIFNLRPPKKKLIPTWSVKTVLSFFKERWGDIKSLSLEELTIKMTILIGLVTAKRPSSIALMTVLPDHYRQLQDSVEFALIGLEKHSREDYVQEPVVIYKYKDPRLDPVAHIKEYVKRTDEIRQSFQLIESDRMPHKAANPVLISKFLKDAII